MKNILCVYPGPLFSNDINHIAGSGRLVNLAQICHEAGYTVTLLGLTKGHPISYGYKGIKTYLITEYKAANKIDEFKNSAKVIEKFCDQVEIPFDMIIFYGSTLKYTKSLRQYCTNHKIKFVQSINEWGRYRFKQSVSYFLQKAGIKESKKADGLIVISNFMIQQYQRFDVINLIKIPSVFDFEEFIWIEPKPTENLLKIGYAGSIANQKDSMAKVVLALGLLTDEELTRLQLHLIGPKEDEIKNLLQKENLNYDRIKGSVFFHELMPRKELQLKLQEFDFTILIRPDLPYSKAGFPTKFGESMALGIPVVANLTSDLHQYLEDGYNGYIVKDDYLSSIAQSMVNLLELKVSDLIKLKVNAKKTGELFNLSHYVHEMKKFIESI